MLTEDIEQTLFVCREVNVFRIPPRVGAGGYKSGDWKLSDKMFTGRLKVVSKGDKCEVKLEDPTNGQLFAACPVDRGQRHIAVEPASDSSRNFVLRLFDPTTKRHAFVGLSFLDRNEAFDFNVALADHEKHLEREHEIQKVVTGSGVSASTNDTSTIAEASLLYKKQDLSLKQGETIKISMKRNSETGGGAGFLSRIGSQGATTSPGLKLAPPPAVGLAPPPQAASQSWMSAPPTASQQPSSVTGFPTAAATTTRDPMPDLFGDMIPPAAPAQTAGDPFAAVSEPFAPKSTANQGANSVVGMNNWAKFD